MSPSEALSSNQISRCSDGAIVVDRPGVVQSIGHTLNRAFDCATGMPEDFATLLGQIDELDQSVER